MWHFSNTDLWALRTAEEALTALHVGATGILTDLDSARNYPPSTIHRFQWVPYLAAHWNQTKSFKNTAVWNQILGILTELVLWRSGIGIFKSCPLGNCEVQRRLRTPAPQYERLQPCREVVPPHLNVILPPEFQVPFQTLIHFLLLLSATAWTRAYKHL